MNLAHFWNPLHRLAAYVKLVGGEWVVFLEAMTLCHLPRLSLDFQKNDTRGECINHAYLLLTKKHHDLLPADPKAIVLEALWKAWKLEA